MRTTSEIKAFNKLFADYQGLFVRFANTYINDKDVSEDIVIEGIMYYWENKDKLTSDSNIPAYILEVIKHKCLNYLRHIRIREDVEQNIREHHHRVNNLRIATLEACDPEELFSIEAQQLINEALKLMSDKTRQIFIMSRFENKTYSEIAECFELSEKSVEYHISKALKIMRLKLKDYIVTLLFFII
ncbi:RNA polymerase sigma-70 factor [Massilibacteroides vaginae]|uniref:RNA polymerase sigma-70 factor n=1 Tax=Massilibacteroides vaginae TaxID=1673718 RepID=UPI000A1CDF67|nr:RNA polymerase sigma-70 factor [Massilibacteroides vaginae]